MGDNMNNNNLVPFNVNNASENGRKGGLASVKAKKERKTMRECLTTLLELKASEDSKELIKKTLDNKNIDTTEEITNQLAICLALINKAINGDTKAYEVIRDTIGEKPTDKLQHNGTEDIIINVKTVGDVTEWAK